MRDPKLSTRRKKEKFLIPEDSGIQPKINGMNKQLASSKLQTYHLIKNRKSGCDKNKV